MLKDLVVLGTGSAMVTGCYNTCFLLRADEGMVLTDTGGGNGILVQLERVGVSVTQLHHIILTHEHCDHLLGIIWLVRKAAALMLADSYDGTLHIYGHAELMQTVRTMVSLTLQQKMIDLFDRRILLCAVKDGECVRMPVGEVTFFDIHSTKAKQYGFLAADGKLRVTCLGDEPYHTACEQYVRGSDWVLSEAFCLYEERERFRPYEKHHSTVKEACEMAQQLEIPHLVLWHTEDKCLSERKVRYTSEGRKYYQGSLYVPDDLEILTL